MLPANGHPRTPHATRRGTMEVLVWFTRNEERRHTALSFARFSSASLIFSSLSNSILSFFSLHRTRTRTRTSTHNFATSTALHHPFFPGIAARGRPQRQHAGAWQRR